MQSMPACSVLCCSKRKARKDELAEKLARLEASAGLVAQMKAFEKAQAWAVIDERMGTAEALRKRLQVRYAALRADWGYDDTTH
jgi:hypothetical protein